MSVNFRNFGQAKQVLPKYLSDSLTPWWGNWSVGADVLGISYTNLPPIDVLAKVTISVAVGLYAAHRITFNIPQNLNGYVLEYWIRGNTPPATARTYVNLDAGRYMYTGSPAVTTVWTKRTYSIPSPSDFTQYGLLPKSVISSRVGYIYLEYWNAVAPYDVEIAGFNLRRL